MRTETRHCGHCCEDREFETPPSADGDSEGCPERACTACGTGLLVQPEPLPAATGALAESAA